MVVTHKAMWQMRRSPEADKDTTLYGAPLALNPLAYGAQDNQVKGYVTNP